MIYNIYLKSKINDFYLNGTYDSDSDKTIILKGSKYKKDAAKSLLPHNVRFRKKILSEYGSEKNILIKNCEFKNASAAISALIGNQGSGLGLFRVKETGLTLKETLFPDLQNKKSKRATKKETLVENFFVEEEIVNKPKEIDNAIKTSRVFSVGKKAIIKSGYTCFVNADHKTFYTDKGVPYMEAHHLIPFKYQKEFPYSLQVPANVVCLCPQCHRELHYGKNRKEILRQLYDDRVEALKECGLNISFDDLLRYYVLKRKK